MADSSVTLNSGSGGESVDTRTTTGGEHRQVVVIGEGADASDAVVGADATNGLDVDVTRVQGSVTVAQGTAANLNCTEASAGAIKTAVELIDDIVKAEDDASSNGDKGAVVFAIRDDTLDARSGTEGDYEPFHLNANGALWTDMADRAGRDCGKIDIAAIDVSIPAGTNNIGDVDVASIAAGDNNIGNVDIVTFPAEVHSADFDSGGGTDTTLAFGIAVPASGGAAVVTGDTSNGLDVDVTRVGGNVTVINAGTFAVQVDGSALTALQLIDDIVHVDDTATHSTGSTKGALIMAAATPTDAAVSANDIGAVAMTTDRKLHVSVQDALPAGTAAIGKLAANSGVDIGDVDVTSISAGTNAIGNVGLIGRTTGGMTIFRSLDIDESEEEIKATAGQVFSIAAFNRTAAPLYLKFYNATAANVTVGSTTPVLTFVVPGNADSDGAGFIWNNEIGFAFGTAITVACTTGVADADTGAPGANDCVINVGYV